MSDLEKLESIVLQLAEAVKQVKEDVDKIINTSTPKKRTAKKKTTKKTTTKRASTPKKRAPT